MKRRTTALALMTLLVAGSMNPSLVRGSPVPAVASSIGEVGCPAGELRLTSSGWAIAGLAPTQTNRLGDTTSHPST